MDGARRAVGVVAVVLPLVALGTAGCESRHEPIRTVGGARRWPVAGGRPADGGGPAVATADVEFVEGYEAAARRAAVEGRPMLLVFGASWCRWSGALARGPLADRDVVARTRRFVCVLVDADRDAATCRTFGITAFPTVVVLDAGGGERFRAAGAGVGRGLAAALDAVPSLDGDPTRLAGEERRAGAESDVTR